MTCGAASAAPLPTRDQNPLLAGFALPLPAGASIGPPGQWSFAADLNWANTAMVQQSARETLIVDAETRELRLGVERAFAERFAMRLEVPWRYTGGGSLDSLIDEWHSFFGLQEGDRPLLPRDQMRITYAREGAVLLDARSPDDALGDVSLAAGLALHSTGPWTATAWFTLELPTGDAEQFTGSEALDASVALAGQRRFDTRWAVFAQAGASRLGKGGLLADQQREIVWSALAGVSWRAASALELTAQLAAHSAVFDSELDFLGESLTLTLGGSLHFGSDWRLDLAITEDIAVETAPDVAFVIGVAGAH